MDGEKDRERRECMQKGKPNCKKGQKEYNSQKRTYSILAENVYTMQRQCHEVDSASLQEI